MEGFTNANISILNYSNFTPSNEAHAFVERLSIVMWVLLSAISCVNLMGNGTLIYVICSRRRLRKQVSPNWFVLSLGVADFLVGGFTLSNALMCRYSTTLETVCSEPHFYYAQLVLDHICFTASVVNLCVLTLDIYLGVMHPYRYQTFMTASTASVIIFTAWLVSIAQNIPLLVYFMEPTHPKEALLADSVIQVSFMTAIPSFFMIYAYVRIFIVARQHTKAIEKLQVEVALNEKETKLNKRGRNGTVKAVAVMVAIFLFCNAFYLYYCICEYWQEYLTFSIELRVVTILLRHFNSTPNFFVYTLLRKDFRKELTMSLRWRRKDNKPASTDMFTF